MNQGGVRACCAVCNQQTHRRCSRCLSIYYCNTEHQRQDWKRHKTECTPKVPKQGTKKDKFQECSTSNEGPKKVKEEIINCNEDSESINLINQEGSETRRSRKSKKKSSQKEGSDTNSDNKQNSEVIEQVEQSIEGKEPCKTQDNSVISSVVYTDKSLSSGSAITYEGSSEQEILRESAQQLSADFVMASSSNVLRAINRTDMRVPSLAGYTQHSGTSRKEYPEATLRGSVAPFSNAQNSYHMDPSDPCYEICQRVIRDMTQYGVCVLDNFLGKDRGHLVLNEVLDMYKSGIFQVSFYSPMLTFSYYHKSLLNNEK